MPTLSICTRGRDDEVEVRAERPYHAASLMKVGVLLAVKQAEKEGRWAMTDSMQVHNRFSSAAGGTFAVEDDTDDALHARVGEDVAVGDLAERMIAVSSNLAANLLLEALGVEAVQAAVDAVGAEEMRIWRGVEDLAAYEAGLINTTTARAVAELLYAVAQDRALGTPYDGQVRAILQKQVYRGGIPAGVPDGVAVANKTGWTSTVRHDAAIIDPDGAAPWVLVVLTEGMGAKAAAERRMADIAARLAQQGVTGRLWDR